MMPEEETLTIVNEQGRRITIRAPKGTSREDMIAVARQKVMSPEEKKQDEEELYLTFQNFMEGVKMDLKAGSNYPASLERTVRSAGRGFFYSPETKEAFKNLSTGIAQKYGLMEGHDKISYADQVESFLSQRYGSAEAIKNTLTKDPVGMATDIGMFLGSPMSMLMGIPRIVGGISSINLKPLADVVHSTAPKTALPVQKPAEAGGPEGGQIKGGTLSPEQLQNQEASQNVLYYLRKRLLEPAPLQGGQSATGLEGGQQVQARQEGGPTEPGEILVGEKGKEIVVPQRGRPFPVGTQGPEVISMDQPGTVVPNDYDYAAWQKANPGVTMSPGQHYPDTYK